MAEDGLDEKAKQGWKVKLIDMLISQGPSFLILVTILCILTSAIKDFVKVELPKIIDSHNTAYTKINLDNQMSMAIKDKRQSEDLVKLEETFNKALATMERMVNIKYEIEQRKSNAEEKK